MSNENERKTAMNRAALLITDIPFMYHCDIQLLSQMIRRTCFKEKLIRKKSRPNGVFSVIPLKDMTDEEYARYTDILDKVLEPFMKNAVEESK